MKKSLLTLTIVATFSLASLGQVSNLNDEFNDAATLANWNNLNTTEGWNLDRIETLDINTSSNGKLVLVPKTVSWFGEYRGPLIYKTVSGDFTFTTQVTVTNRDQNNIASPTINSPYSLAGVMLRSPRNITNGQADWTANGENYVFLATGHASAIQFGNAGPGPHFEVKNTINSNSVLEVSAINTQTITIRLARVGNAIIVLRQSPGEDFVVHKRYDRSDMPNEVQIGFVSYTDWAKVSSFTTEFHNTNNLNPTTNSSSSNPSLDFNPDVRAEFEFARFTNPTVPANLQGVDLVNSASDQQLLSFLGFNSIANSPTGINNEFLNKPKVYLNDYTLTVSAVNESSFYKVYSIVGQELIHSTQPEIDISSLTSGIYILVTENGTVRFVKH